MQSNILHYFSKTNAQYLHANGKFGTERLIQQLDCKENEKILEIGFGTGTTLVYLFAAYPNTTFYGVEKSDFMYQKARKRLLFCGAKRGISLSLMHEKNKLPFEAHSFDKIYIESVLGIQEDNDLGEMIQEIKRVLKPNGILVINETIWLDNITLAEIKQLNEFCKQNFGIIQSNESYPYVADWVKLFEIFGFKCESTHKFADIKADSVPKFPFPYSFLSSLFTNIGRVMAFFNWTMKREKQDYEQKMKAFHSSNKPLMEGILMRFQSAE